jgi:hypothetical protein
MQLALLSSTVVTPLVGRGDGSFLFRADIYVLVAAAVFPRRQTARRFKNRRVPASSFGFAAAQALLLISFFAIHSDDGDGVTAGR